MASLIVGIYSSTPGAGKTTVANALSWNGFVRLKFASALKNMIRSLLITQGLDKDTIHEMLEGSLKEIPTPYLCGRSPRYAMQTIGTEWGRHLIGENIWLDVMQRQIDSVVIKPKMPIVIDDLRFPNEFEFLRNQEHKTILVRIERLNAESKHAHISEGSLSNHNFDLTFYNDPNKFTAEQFGKHVMHHIVDFVINGFKVPSYAS